ncbi:hypothetical protein JJ691_31380 [Kutzneria sp. CA-103260]|nr:hypothetical protein JJ691_31380 [Kutzneria sp. CA-103260]
MHTLSINSERDIVMAGKTPESIPSHTSLDRMSAA